MNDGWISLHRKMVEWEWYSDINVCRLFIHCLLKANHKTKKWQGNKIERGTFITSLKTLSHETGLSMQQVRGCIAKLESTGEINKRTTTVNTWITITKYEKYQKKNKPTTNDQQTDNKPITTTNNDNNDNNDNNYVADSKKFTAPSKDQVIEYFKENGYSPDAGAKAFEYYNVADWKDSKGSKVKNWKQKMRGVWFKDENKQTNQSPVSSNGLSGGYTF
jgi:hypothetical protein